MFKAAKFDIRFDQTELVVSPSLKSMNRLGTARQLSAEIDRAVESIDEEHPTLTDVVIDLGNVTWISSAGLNTLIRLQASVREAGRCVKLRSMNETVRDVFRITRLERVFACEAGPTGTGSE